MGGGEIEALTRRAFERWNARDYDHLLELFEEEATWDMSPIGVPGMHEYRGHSRIRRFFEEWLEAFPDSSVEVESVEQRGEWGFATVIQRVHGGSSGVPATFHYYGIGHWRSGRLTFVENYVDRELAWDAFRLYTEAPTPEHQLVGQR
jgi:ketosteroid isomerase-like protein